ncbi:uncharacterized [Lates japonicus]
MSQQMLSCPLHHHMDSSPAPKLNAVTVLAALCHLTTLQSEAFAGQPFLQLLIEVTFNRQGHGDLIDLCGQLFPCHLLQVLLHVLLQSPNVPLHFSYERCPAASVGQVGVDRDVVHAGAADHVRQRRGRICRRGPARRGGTGVFRRSGNP